MTYKGDYYEPIGDFLKEKYLEYGFTKGTKQEVDFLISHLGLEPGARILDIGCGPGRHSLELARRGFRPVGIDISSGFIEVAQRQAAEEGLDATFLVADARALTFEQAFDATICLCEGAFGLAGSDEGHRQILANIFTALRPGAPFVLTAMNAYWQCSRPGFDPQTSTITEIETIESPTGEQREVTFHTTSFTLRELRWLFEGAGFTEIEGFGCQVGAFEARPLTVNDLEVMIVARRSA